MNQIVHKIEEKCLHDDVAVGQIPMRTAIWKPFFCTQYCQRVSSGGREVKNVKDAIQTPDLRFILRGFHVLANEIILSILQMKQSLPFQSPCSWFIYVTWDNMDL